jgi:cell division protein FtsB
MRILKISAAIGIIVVCFLYLQEHGNVQKNALQSKIDDLKQQNTELEHDIGFLEQKISKLRSDPKTLEKVAKRKLGMVRTDETIYIFETDDKKK